MRDQLRIGIAGCGAIVQHAHLPLLQRRPDVELVAVADPDGAAVASAVRRCPGVQSYASLSDMLSDVELDAVVIALPSALHAAAASEVFRAGIHAYIEKPLAITVEEANDVVDAWRRSGRIGVLGFNCRANPLLVRMRNLLQRGRAGSLVYLRTVFATASKARLHWRGQRTTGGGALLDLGVHHIDLIRFLTGADIMAVRATISSRRSEHDTALLELQLENGIGVHAFFSLAAAEMDHVEVHGEAARLSVARFTSLDVQIVDNPGRRAALSSVLRRAAALRYLPRMLAARGEPLREPGYEILLDRFVRAARSGSVPADAPTIADGFACAAVVAAAEASLISGRAEKPAVMKQHSEPLLRALS